MATREFEIASGTRAVFLLDTTGLHSGTLVDAEFPHSDGNVVMEENVLVFRKHPLKHVGIQLTLKRPRKNPPRERSGTNDRPDGQREKQLLKLRDRSTESYLHISHRFSLGCNV